MPPDRQPLQSYISFPKLKEVKRTRNHSFPILGIAVTRNQPAPQTAQREGMGVRGQRSFCSRDVHYKMESECTQNGVCQHLEHYKISRNTGKEPDMHVWDGGKV